MSTVEQAAILLWHRFAPETTEKWEDETHKAEYRLAAEEVLKLTAPVPGGTPVVIMERMAPSPSMNLSPDVQAVDVVRVSIALNQPYQVPAKVGGWRPIGEALKDGTPVYITEGYSVVNGKFSGSVPVLAVFVPAHEGFADLWATPDMKSVHGRLSSTAKFFCHIQEPPAP